NVDGAIQVKNCAAPAIAAYRGGEATPVTAPGSSVSGNRAVGDSECTAIIEDCTAHTAAAAAVQVAGATPEAAGASGTRTAIEGSVSTTTTTTKAASTC